MESNTTGNDPQPADSFIFELGSLYSYFTQLKDKRKPKGMRYPLALILTLIVLAKLAGQNRQGRGLSCACHCEGALASEAGRDRSNLGDR